MKDSFYGRIQQTEVSSRVEEHAEEIRVKGFTIVPDVIPAAELDGWREKIDRIYAVQEESYGYEALKRIQELDVCRAPMLYDFSFSRLAASPALTAVVKLLLGDWFILNLQNSIINRSNLTHHQSSWHRDLPYQNWVISRPIAINALIAVDDFSALTGGTQVVPFTHKQEILPSDAYIANNTITANAPAGSAIVFDSMLFHRAGSNTSGHIRRAINHLYTIPIMKQQYDFSRALGEHPELTPELRQLLGYTSQVPLNEKVWRDGRVAKQGA